MTANTTEQSMPVPVQPARSRALPWLVAAVGLVALLGVWSWYASRPALVWYVSPPLDASGARLHVLVPRGWEPHEVASPEELMAGYMLLYVSFDPPRGDLPKWIAWLIPGRSLAGHLSLDVQRRTRAEIASLPPEYGSVLAIGHEEVQEVKNGGIAHKGVISPDGRVLATVIYRRLNSRAFAATHSAICNSLKIK